MISKLISEFRIINTLTKYIIIRLPILYTDKMDNFLDSVITTIGKKVINRIENFIENDYYIRRPLFVYDLRRVRSSKHYASLIVKAPVSILRERKLF